MQQNRLLWMLETASNKSGTGMGADPGIVIEFSAPKGLDISGYGDVT